jgi:carboxylesterase
VTAEVLPGAEPFSSPAAPGAPGALVLHGFTGCPQSMRPLALAFADAGFATELPRLPGHGTNVEEMATTNWTDWSAAALDAYDELAARCPKVVVAGLSMGGTLTLWVAAHRPGVGGIVVVNGAIAPTDVALRSGLQELIDSGTEFIPGVGNDVADDSVKELAYDQVPLKALLSLFDASDEMQSSLAAITCPALIMNSPNDHVVPPAASDHLASALRGPVTRVTLERSYHVATIDYDKDLIAREAVAFAQRVTKEG